MIILIMVSALVFLGVGFAIGNVVYAALNTTGNPEDPLVARSYVNDIVANRTAALQSSIDDLMEELTAMRTAYEELVALITDKPGDQPSQQFNTVEIYTPGGSPVFLRPGPGTEYTPPAASANPGDRFKYLGTEKDTNGIDWYKLEYTDGQTLYVISTYGILKTL